MRGVVMAVDSGAPGRAAATGCPPQRGVLRNVARRLRRIGEILDADVAIDTMTAQRLARAERRGLQIALVCRTIAFGATAVYYVAALYLSNSAPTFLGLFVLAAMTALGIGNVVLVGTRHDKPWLKFVTSALDVLAICALTVFVSPSRTGDLPQIYAYNSVGIYMLVPFVALAALSLSPRLVVFTGTIACIGWWAAFSFIVLGMERTVSWADIPDGATREVYESIIHSPDFIARGTRLTEILVLLLTTMILAVAVVRARHLFFAQVRAEAEREAERAARERLSRQFGRYVPAEIARRLADNPAGLAPQVRHGAALMMDIENFTGAAEGRNPADVIAALNGFLAQCADAVSGRDGVVITFTGDGLLATFNTPLEVRAPEEAALAAAADLATCAARHGLRIRVGVAAGPIAAGSVGSDARQAFTVYGDTVNRAARLEGLGKAIGATILVDAATAQAAGGAMTSRGAHALRGFSEEVEVFEPALPPRG
jgi:class 3 adenylate cyclase